MAYFSASTPEHFLSQALTTFTSRSPASSMRDSHSGITPFNLPSNIPEEDSPCVKFFPTDPDSDKNGLFNTQNKITSVLKNPHRTYNEAVLLYKYLKTSSYYQKFREDHSSLRVTDALIHLSRNLKYNAYSPGTVIHRKGDKSNGRIYIIFSGKVALGTEAFQQEVQIEPPKPPRMSNPVGSLSHIGFEGTPKSRLFLPTRVGTMTDVPLEKNITQDLPFVSRQLKKIVKTIRMNNKEIVKVQSVASYVKNDSKTPANKIEDMTIPNISMVKSLQRISTPGRVERERSFKSMSSSNKWKEICQNLETRPSLENLEVISKQKASRLASEAVDTSMEMDVTPSNEMKLKKEKSNPTRVRGKLLRRSNGRTTVMDEKEVHEEVEEEGGSLQSLDHYITGTERGLRRCLGRGDTFGDEALKGPRHMNGEAWSKEREFTVEVVGDKECEVLSFCKEDLELLYARYEKTNTSLLDFLIDHIPKLEKVLRMEKSRQFEELFTEETLTWHQNVTVQGEKGNKVYLLFDGLCEILKNHCSKNSTLGNQDDLSSKKVSEGLIRDFGRKAKSILICILKPGVFLGEEILFNGTGDYDYTVKAGSTQAKLLSIEKETFMKYIPKEIQDELRKLYNEKMKHNMEIFSKKLQLQLNGLKEGQQKPKQLELEESPVDKKKKFIENGHAHTHSRSTKALATLTGKMYQSVKITVKEDPIKPTKELGWSKRKGSEPVTYQDRGMRTSSEERFKQMVEMRKTPLMLQNIRGKENNKGNDASEDSQSFGRKSADVFKGRKFDFGTEMIGKSLLDKAKERERESELNFKKVGKRTITKEANVGGPRKVIPKNFTIVSTPRNRIETNYSTTSLNTLTPRKGTLASFEGAIRLKTVEKMEDEGITERRSTLQKVVMEKQGRAFSIVGLENAKPLKDEARDSYPRMGVSGKPIGLKQGGNK